MIVETSAGRVEGAVRDGVNVFFGIPYAAPPVGDLRLRAPRPAARWKGVRSALERPAAPPQARNQMEALAGARATPPQSEDCLSLSVWTPGCDDAKRPVMVWFHGGGLMFGWSADPSYDGALLASRGDVVVVTVTYRLGALGILAHPELADDESGACGNFHLLDQVASLRWVRDEIAAFGGDPSRVTIFGESAGAMSCGALCATPSARGLFHRAIVQSGGSQARELAEQASTAEKLAAEAGVASVRDLRDAPLEAIMAAQESAGLAQTSMRGGGFTVDGTVLPRAPLDAVRAGCSEGVALMAGTTRDEAKLFSIPLIGREDGFTNEHLVRYAQRLLPGSDVRAVLDGLRAARAQRGEPVTPFELRWALQTEFEFRKPSVELLEAHMAHTSSAFAYLLTWTSKARGGALGSPHAIDIPFTFGNFGAGRLTGEVGDAERALCAAVQDAWTSFAATGDPSSGSLGAWPRYETTGRPTMVLDVESGVAADPRAAERLLWDAAR